MNHVQKFRLIPYASENVSSDPSTEIKTKMSEVLSDSEKTEDEKILYYHHLLRKLQNLASELTTVPRVEIVPTKRTDVVPVFSPPNRKKGMLEKIVQTVRADETGRMVLDGRLIEGTNLQEILSFGFHKGITPMPPGYREFYEYAKTFGKLSKPLEVSESLPTIVPTGLATPSQFIPPPPTVMTPTYVKVKTPVHTPVAMQTPRSRKTPRVILNSPKSNKTPKSARVLLKTPNTPLLKSPKKEDEVLEEEETGEEVGGTTPAISKMRQDFKAESLKNKAPIAYYLRNTPVTRGLRSLRGKGQSSRLNIRLWK